MPLAALPFVMRPGLAIAACLGVIALRLAWISPAVPIGLGGVTTLLASLGVVPDGSPLGLAVFGWIVLGVAFSLLRTRDEPSGAPLVLTVPFAFSLMLAVLLLIRLPGSWDESYGATKLNLFVTLNLISLVAGVVAARRPRDLDIALALILGLSTIGAGALVLGIAGGQQAIFDGRYALGVSQDPIELGRVSTIGLVIALYALLFREGRWRLAAFAALPLLTVAELAAGSRGPFLGLIVGVGVLLWRRRRALIGGSRTGLTVAAIAATGLVAVQLAPGSGIDRAAGVFLGGGGDAGRSSNGRFDLWAVAWHGVSDHPLAGVGTGGFGALRPGERYPHNVFLEIAAEVGVVGLLLMVGLVVAGIRLMRTRPGADGLDRGHMIVASALFAAAVVNALFSGDITTNAALWLALGLAIGVSRRAPERPRPARDPSEPYVAVPSSPVRP